MTDHASTCPKCGFPRPEGVEACARCGLVFSLWSPEVAATVAVLDEEAERLWSVAVAAWETPGHHDAFLKHCSLLGLLAPAGRRYRERIDRDPADPIARRMQERVLQMASTVMVVSRPAAVAQPITRKGWFWAAIFMAFGVSIAAAMLWSRLHR